MCRNGLDDHIKKIPNFILGNSWPSSLATALTTVTGGLTVLLSLATTSAGASASKLAAENLKLAAFNQTDPAVAGAIANTNERITQLSSETDREWERADSFQVFIFGLTIAVLAVNLLSNLYATVPLYIARLKLIKARTLLAEKAPVADDYKNKLTALENISSQQLAAQLAGRTERKIGGKNDNDKRLLTSFHVLFPNFSKIFCSRCDVKYLDAAKPAEKILMEEADGSKRKTCCGLISFDNFSFFIAAILGAILTGVGQSLYNNVADDCRAEGIDTDPLNDCSSWRTGVAAALFVVAAAAAKLWNTFATSTIAAEMKLIESNTTKAIAAIKERSAGLIASGATAAQQLSVNLPTGLITLPAAATGAAAPAPAPKAVTLSFRHSGLTVGGAPAELKAEVKPA